MGRLYFLIVTNLSHCLLKSGFQNLILDDIFAILKIPAVKSIIPAFQSVASDIFSKKNLSFYLTNKIFFPAKHPTH